MSHIRPTRLAFGLAALLALFTALTSLANASVPGLQRVAASSLNDSLFTKGSFAACPPGTSVLGGGARIFPGNGQIVVDAITPDSAARGVLGRGFEDRDGTGL